MDSLIGNDVFEPLPEIEHVFQAEPQMPPAILSLVFSGAVLAPFVLLILFWISQGINIKQFPYNKPSQFLSSVLFIGGLGAYLFVMYLFFLTLNGFQMLALVVPLNLALVVVGKRAMSDLLLK